MLHLSNNTYNFNRLGDQECSYSLRGLVQLLPSLDAGTRTFIRLIQISRDTHWGEGAKDHTVSQRGLEAAKKGSQDI